MYIKYTRYKYFNYAEYASKWWRYTYIPVVGCYETSVWVELSDLLDHHLLLPYGQVSVKSTNKKLWLRYVSVLLPLTISSSLLLLSSIISLMSSELYTLFCYKDEESSLNKSNLVRKYVNMHFISVWSYMHTFVE